MTLAMPDTSPRVLGRMRPSRQVVVSECSSKHITRTNSPTTSRCDSFTCPQGQTSSSFVCWIRMESRCVCTGPLEACPFCTRAKEIGRSLAIGPHLCYGHRAWMSTSAAREAYKLNWSSLRNHQGTTGGTEVPTARPLTPEWTCLPQLQLAHSLAGVALQPSVYLMARSLVPSPDLQ